MAKVKDKNKINNIKDLTIEQIVCITNGQECGKDCTQCPIAKGNYDTIL